MLTKTPNDDAKEQLRQRARVIKLAGTIGAAMASGALSKMLDVTLSEALVLGLLNRG